jgi:hypothetical protein
MSSGAGPVSGSRQYVDEHSYTAKAGRHKGIYSPIKKVLGCAAIVAVLVLPSAIRAPEASAHTPHPTDGCSNSPDRPYGFSFKSSCDRHDVCYAHKPYGRTAAGRARCDSVFYTNLASWCRNNLTNDAGWHRDFWGVGVQFLWNPENTCLDTAAAYRNAVQRYGCHAFWQDGQPWWYSCEGR